MRLTFALLLGGLTAACAAAAPPSETGRGAPPGQGMAVGSDVGAGPGARGGASGTPTSVAAPVDAGPVGVGAASVADGGAGSEASGPAPAHRGPLATFHDALRELACGRRAQHVRIAWLGDSHAQADFWSGRVRTGLQGRFGNGGPGFVRVGYRGYRHDGIHLAMHGRWYQRPKRPATTERYQDGNLGLGGILSTGYADKPWTTVTLTDPALEGRKLTWELCYRLNKPEDRFRVQISGAPRRSIRAEGKLGGLRHLTLEAKGLAKLEVSPREGRPFFCGVIIETDPAKHPGVVLDNLGIDGARYATALAWDPVFWGAELTRRNPELVIIEYGGNEASDFASRPQAYKRHLLRLIDRVRQVRPDTSCLVIGLTDRADAESRVPPIRDATREGAREAQCMFWDSYEVMGGRGSMARWRDEKKAAEDGVHLLPRGYAELGEKLLQDLLADYRPGCDIPAPEP